MDIKERGDVAQELTHAARPATPFVRHHQAADLEAMADTIIGDFASSQLFVQVGARSKTVTDAFENCVKAHYIALVSCFVSFLRLCPLIWSKQMHFRRAADPRWRSWVCSLCATAMRLYSFNSLIRRLRRGAPTYRHPWTDWWITPTPEFAAFITFDDLGKHIPPLNGTKPVSFSPFQPLSFD